MSPSNTRISAPSTPYTKRAQGRPAIFNARPCPVPLTLCSLHSGATWWARTRTAMSSLSMSDVPIGPNSPREVSMQPARHVTQRKSVPFSSTLLAFTPFPTESCSQGIEYRLLATVMAKSLANRLVIGQMLWTEIRLRPLPFQSLHLRLP